MVSDAHLDEQQLVTVMLGAATPSVRAHVHNCPTCRRDVAVWSTIRSGTVVASSSAEAPLPDWVLLGALERVAAEPSPAPVLAAALARRRARWCWRLLCGQIRLVRRSIAAASALMLLLGVVVVINRSVGHGAVMLSVLAPLAAAVGLTLIYGPEIDPASELTATTGTSPRMVLLARLVLVCGYDFGLATAATVLAVALGEPGGFVALVGDWFGPMLALAALSLALAVLLRPGVGVAVALGLWALRLMAGFGSGTVSVQGLRLLSAGQAQAVRSAWTTSAPILIAAVALVTVAVVAAPRRLRLAA